MISLAEQWKDDCPDGAGHSDIAAYLKTVSSCPAHQARKTSIDSAQAGIYPFYHDQYHSLADFRDQYAKQYGKAPFVHRALHWQWYSYRSCKMPIKRSADVLVSGRLEGRFLDRNAMNAGVVPKSTGTGYSRKSSMQILGTSFP